MGYLNADLSETLDSLREKCLRDSLAWFPDVHESADKFLLHSALGLAGESGEAVDVIKKWHRRKGEPLTDAERKALAAELADVLIYMLHICSAAEIDLGHAVLVKRAKNARRFG